LEPKAYDEVRLTWQRIYKATLQMHEAKPGDDLFHIGWDDLNALEGAGGPGSGEEDSDDSDDDNKPKSATVTPARRKRKVKNTSDSRELKGKVKEEGKSKPRSDRSYLKKYEAGKHVLWAIAVSNTDPFCFPI
jgi:hypothetical protein